MWFETDLVGPKVVTEMHQNNGEQLLHVNFEHHRFFWSWRAGTIVSGQGGGHSCRSGIVSRYAARHGKAMTAPKALGGVLAMGSEVSR